MIKSFYYNQTLSSFRNYLYSNQACSRGEERNKALSMEEDNSQQIDNNSTEEDPVAAAIYDRLITSVCVSYACKMHQAIKTGQVPYYELAAPQDRQELYPDLYENQDDVNRALEKYVVEKPAKRPRSDSSYPEQDTASVKDEAASETKSIISTRQQALTDIWGRNPPKEPKELVECSICQRQVNTLRFAQHLDKCMGIGTTTRAAAAGGPNGTSTRSSSK